MSSLLERAAAAIADFANPFYGEERQRDIANEADAFGFWLLFWTLLWAAGATCWFLPRYYVAAGAVAAWVLVVSLLANRYARHLGVRIKDRDRKSGPWRVVLVGLTGAWLGIGFAQAAITPNSASWALPFLVTYVAFGVPVALLRWKARRQMT